MKGIVAGEKVYISQDQIQKCWCCGRKEDTRMGICWDCATAESIIGQGMDMFDKPMPVAEHNTQYSESLNQIKFLILKGWMPPKK